MSDDLLGDLYSYESLLSDDERKELAGIREFLQEEVRPRVNDSWESATFPMDLIPRFAEQGLVGRSYDLAGSPRAPPPVTGRLPPAPPRPGAPPPPPPVRGWSAAATTWPARPAPPGCSPASSRWRPPASTPRWRPSSVSTTAWRWVRSWSSARGGRGRRARAAV